MMSTDMHCVTLIFRMNGTIKDEIIEGQGS